MKTSMAMEATVSCDMVTKRESNIIHDLCSNEMRAVVAQGTKASRTYIRELEILRRKFQA